LPQETADEGQGGADAEGTAPPTGAPTTATAPGAPAGAAPANPAGPNPSGPAEANGPSSPITMEDIMSGIIEMQLKKTPNATGQSPALGQPPSTGERPTISSILNTDSPVCANPRGGYRLNIAESNLRMSPVPGPAASKPPLPVMKLPYHAASADVTLPNNDLPKEGLVLQVHPVLSSRS